MPLDSQNRGTPLVELRNQDVRSDPIADIDIRKTNMAAEGRSYGPFRKGCRSLVAFDLGCGKSGFASFNLAFG